MLVDVGCRGRECVTKAVYKQEKVAAPSFDSECNLSSANASSQQIPQSQYVCQDIRDIGSDCTVVTYKDGREPISALKRSACRPGDDRRPEGRSGHYLGLDALDRNAARYNMATGMQVREIAKSRPHRTFPDCSPLAPSQTRGLTDISSAVLDVVTPKAVGGFWQYRRITMSPIYV